MTRTKITSLIFSVVLAGLLITGCAGTEADLSATAAPPVCLTAEPLSCPTTASFTCPTPPSCPPLATAQFSSTEKYWSAQLAMASGFYISFEPGDQCLVNAPSLLGSGKYYFHIKVKDQAHATYGVIFSTLDEGKTLSDMLAYPKTATEPPSWAHSFREIYLSPGSDTYFADDFPTGQFYIGCFTSTDKGIQRILDYGPMEVK